MSPRGNIMLAKELARNRTTGLCQMLKLKEENVRFVLLAFLLCIYLVIGAVVFQSVEQSREREMRDHWNARYEEFWLNVSKSIEFEREIDEHVGAGMMKTSTEALHEESTERQGNPNRDREEKLGDDGEDDRNNYAWMSRKQLDGLLKEHGNAVKAGLTNGGEQPIRRDRWDFVGSFHFAWTIVSTIGYGAMTPGSSAGKLLIIPYGFLGCAGGLLFFNLFLERIITFLAYIMRLYRKTRQKRRAFIHYRGSRKDGQTDMWGRRASHSSAGNGSTTMEDADWKPSVYWVMLCLFVMSAIIILSSASLFTKMEGWSYIESIYFCFVSYATIGFGDLVLLQRDHYHVYAWVENLYRIGAFVITVLGCCCIYSLLNVTSIVIKQSLNWLIKTLDCRCCFVWCRCSSASIRRRMSSRRRAGSRRNGNSGGRMTGSQRAKGVNRGGSVSISMLKACQIRGGGKRTETDEEMQDTRRDDDDERRYSGENMISIQGELSNKVSLAVMQKRLLESAQAQQNYNYGEQNHRNKETFSATSVGPLAIVTEKVADSSNNHQHYHG